MPKHQKVLGTKNPADILTKHVGGELLALHLMELKVSCMEGRSEKAPALDSIGEYLEEWEEKQVKHVKFAPVVKFRAIPPEGKQRPTSTAKKISCICTLREIIFNL